MIKFTFFLHISTKNDISIGYIIFGDNKMNIFEMLILNMILISFSLLVYTIYIVANKDINKREKDSLFDFALISSAFLVIHYGGYFEGKLLSFFLGSIVLLAMTKKRYVLSLVVELCVLGFYYPDILSMIYFAIVYGLFNLLGYLYHKHTNLKISYLTSYFILYSSSFFLWFLLFDLKDVGYSLLLIIVYIIMVKILMVLVTKGEEIMCTHVTFKELQKEKQIQLSLFKITHEIKNPVAVCKAYLDMFDVNNSDHAKKYVPILKDEIERLLLLLQDFLLVNKANMKYEVMDLNMLLEDVTRNIQPIMDENHILFQVDTLEDELFIHGDYNRLSQVMINMLKNSVEAKASNITLRTHLTNKELEVYVEDNGQGMSEDIYARIYEPFYTTKPRGTGLGVSLSNEIIHAHNGKLEYFSKYGLGTSVKITLPLYLI